MHAPKKKSSSPAARWEANTWAAHFVRILVHTSAPVMENYVHKDDL